MNAPPRPESPYREPQPAPPQHFRGRAAPWLAGGGVVVACANFILWWALFTAHSSAKTPWFVAFTALAGLQAALGLTAAVVGGIALAQGRKAGAGAGALVGVVGGVLVTAGAAVGWVMMLFGEAMGAVGGAWGRPLRVRGRQLHPGLRQGSDWAAGDRPDPRGLDDETRLALEALWLHDAQKEHASVPAFARISWTLAAVGAPADLTAWAHRAALEEVDHARRCFALAAGYGGRTHSAEPMPDLLVGGLDSHADPLVTLAVESLSDGCQLEDFNADVAAACAEVCQEPTTRSLLAQVAREERSHADFSWALLAWVLERSGAPAHDAVRSSLATLERYPRPTAVSGRNARLVARADPSELLAHGRLPDARWAELWASRLNATGARARALLAAHAPAADRVGNRSPDRVSGQELRQ